MRNSSNNSSSTEVGAGGGFFTLLAILFIALKLTGIIDWSWWLVLSPVWGPFVLFIVVVVAYVVFRVIKDKL